MDLGRNGSTSVNNYNGNLATPSRYQHDQEPYARIYSHVYNSDHKSNQISWVRWRLNLSQSLSTESIEGATYMKYIDRDGTTLLHLKMAIISNAGHI